MNDKRKKIVFIILVPLLL